MAILQSLFQTYRRWKAVSDLAHTRAVYYQILNRWHHQHRLRLPPPEGWQVEYTVTALELEFMQKRVDRALWFIRPTLDEIHATTHVPVHFIREYFGSMVR
jgi:hypothetical protein